jgi:hypothetical protein
MPGKAAAVRAASQRGAMLVPVAMALLLFTVVSASVVNYGIYAISRNQVQTAVDAAALAGATSLAYDSYSDRTTTGPAHTTATMVTAENLVWGEAAAVDGADVEFPLCASTYDPGASVTNVFGCVRVTAYRTTDRGNGIPTLLAGLLDVPSLNVGATATAQTLAVNATDCLRPLAVPDRWTERNPINPGTWTATSQFQKYDLPPGSSADLYTPPTDASAGTGIKTTVEFGLQVTLTPGSVATPNSDIRSWRYLPVQIPGAGTDLRANTNSCADAIVHLRTTGTTLDIAPGAVAANSIAIGNGLLDLINLDPTATWNTATRRIDNSCADAQIGRCGTISPRVIAVAVYDPSALADASRTAVPATVTVRNIAGLFIDSVVIDPLAGATVTGYITRHPGLRVTTAGSRTLTDASSFLRASMLVQ